jgi:hypothetical protein
VSVSTPVFAVPSDPRDIGPLEEWEVFGIARRRARVSQLDLAAESGITQPRISVWERTGVGMGEKRVARVWAALNTLVARDVV